MKVARWFVGGVLTLLLLTPLVLAQPVTPATQGGTIAEQIGNFAFVDAGILRVATEFDLDAPITDRQTGTHYMFLSCSNNVRIGATCASNQLDLYSINGNIQWSLNGATGALTAQASQNVSTGGAYVSSAGSGNFALQPTVEGAKVGFGPDTECHEVGTNITCTSPGGLLSSGPFSTASTTTPQFQCTGAATCQHLSASGQTQDVDCGGGTCTAQLGATNATTTSIGRAGQTTDIKGGTITMQGTAMDFTFCVYNTGNLAAAAAFGETTFTHAVTVNTGSKISQDVVGVGAGNFVVKLCTDGTTCAAGNTYLTYTEACTAVAGTRTAAVVGNSGAIPAGSVGTISVTTACATTDPAANICVHYTMP